MNKLFTKIASLSVGLALAVGVGVAVGGQNAVVRVGATDIPAANLSSSSTCTVSGTAGVKANKGEGATITVPKEAGNCDVTFHAAAWNKEGVAHNVTYTNATSSTTSITLTADSGVSGSGSSYTLSGSESDYVFTVSLTQTSSSDDMVINIAGVSSKRFVVWGASYSGGSTTTYTVSFNGNGGTGSMDSVSGVSGNYKLPSNGFTAPSGKAFSGWKAGNTGDLIAVGGTYEVGADVTFFAQWADAYTVTYSAGENGSGTYAHTLQPAGTYTLLPFNDLTGVSANSGYRFKNYTVSGADKNPGDTFTLSGATSITVNFDIKPLEAVYDFVTNFATYSKAAGSYEGTDWGGYSNRTITASMVDAEYDATITFSNVSKQGNTISDRPVIAAKYNTSSTMLFTLASSVSSSYTITTIDVKFAQWGSKVLNAALYKGTSVSGTALDSFSSSSSPRDLVVDNLNGDSFIVDFVSKDSSGTTNYQLGVTSITIGLAEKAEFGTVDHIKVTSFPNTIYHVGETYDATGFAVTAYDGPDEATANFKDVTNMVNTKYTSGVYTFVESDVPSVDMWVQYTEEGVNYNADDITLNVYALAQYELVTEAAADWSGNYLIVGVDANQELGAFNGSLSMLDAQGNYKGVTADENNVVETGQELEFTIAAISGGYSIRAHNGKYIGWASDSSNGLTASDTALVNTISYSDGAVTIAGSGGRKLTFNNDSTANRFRYYQSGTVSLYKLIESDNADAYAQTFLSAFTCDASGVKKPTFTIKEGTTYWTWALLAEAYDQLTSAEKEQFRLGTPSESGTNIQKALARYDLVVGKYFMTGLDTSFTDFMSRSPDPVGRNTIELTNDVMNNNTMVIIVAIAAVSAISLAVLLVLKKKKHN